MQFNLDKASIMALAATTLAAVASPAGAGAVAEGRTPVLVLPDEPTALLQVAPSPEADSAPAQTPAAMPDDTLDGLVDAQPEAESLGDQLHCLAAAIYFEAKGETRPGQLAVGRVIVNRAASGRFPGSYCGVVYQTSQFAFVRGKAMPAIRTASRAWHDAAAIARIADAGSWRSRAEGALYFHAARVAPNWRRTRIAQVDDHVFYR